MNSNLELFIVPEYAVDNKVDAAIDSYEEVVGLSQCMVGLSQMLSKHNY